MANKSSNTSQERKYQQGRTHTEQLFLVLGEGEKENPVSDRTYMQSGVYRNSLTEL